MRDWGAVRRGRAVCMLLSCLVALTGCGSAGSASSAGAYPVTVQNCGNEVVINERPQRVFLLGNESVSLLSAVGVLDRVVARSGEIEPNLYREPTQAALRRIPLVGRGTSGSGTDQVSLEAVVAQRPDLVVGYLPDNSSVTRAGLARVGLPLIVPPEYCTDPGQAGQDTSFEDVYSRVQLYGQIFDTEPEATRTVAQLRQRVTASTASTPGRPGRSAAALFVYPGGTPPSAYGSRSIVHAQMTALGLRNVFGAVEQRNFEIGSEVVLAKNPDVLVLLYVAGDAASVERWFRAIPGMAELAAVHNGHLVVQPFGFSASATPLAVTGLEHVARQLRVWASP